MALLRGTIAEIDMRASPVGLWRMAAVTEVTRRQIATKEMKWETPVWARLAGQMQGNVRASVFAVTLGVDFDDVVVASQMKSMAMSFVLDAVGSVMVERAADQLIEIISRHPVLQGFVGTRRFSPGYCDWSLTAQSQLFAFLQPEKIGIALMPGGGMRPQKSITAAVLWAEEMPCDSPCPFCPKKGCDHRRGEYIHKIANKGIPTDE